MRVLHFYKTYFPDSFGGVEQFIFELSNGIAIHGVESKILSLSQNLSLPFEINTNGSYRVRTDLKISSTDISIRAFKKFKNLADSVDIIHYHFPWPFMDLAHFFSHINKPTIVSYHSDIIKQQVLLRLYRPLMNRFLNDVDSIVASSPNFISSSQTLQKFKNKVEMIPFGISDSRINVNNKRLVFWKKTLGEKFYLFVGVHRYYKGLIYLVEALAINQFPMVIVGDGPKTKELKNLVEQKNIKNIIFLGEVSDEDKDAIFQLTYGFVFPSHLRAESFGISLLEAAMYGKPMISCEIGTGTSFINIHNETGIVVTPQSTIALDLAMKYLWSNENMACKMGKAARDRYQKLFTSQLMCQAYYDIYSRLIKKADQLF